MAIKQLRMAKNLKDFRSELETVLKSQEELNVREEELKKSVEEAETNEDFDVLENEEREIEETKAELLEKKSQLEGKIAELEAELKELEAEEEIIEDKIEMVEEPKGERKSMSNYQVRSLETLIEQENVKEFLGEVRSAIKNKRGLTGGEYMIPTEVIPVIREEIYKQSKLLPLVTLHKIGGAGRVNLLADVPEAIWTEACAKLNELDIVFEGVELDGYKVGGYIPVCNALLADSDFDLARTVFTAIGGAIAKAVDKAILYGTGTKMPMGVVKALETAGSGLSAVAIDAGNQWLDALGALVVEGEGAVTYVMNAKTLNAVKGDAFTNSALAQALIASNGQLPLGNIVVSSVVADDTIIAGDFKSYVMAERSEVLLARSEHAQFTEDNTVFKGTARYDGKPVYVPAFSAIKFGAAAPESKDVTFAADEANA